MQPFGDRSKVVIEPMLTDQWFVDTAKIVEPALEAVRTGDTRIIPERARRPISTGWRISSPGASRASSGGGTRFRCGMGLDIWPTGFHDDEGDDALDEVEILELLGRRRLCRPRPARASLRRRSWPASANVPRRSCRAAHAAEPCPHGRGRRPARGRCAACGSPGGLQPQPGPDASGLSDLARPRRARHLVLLRPLADRHARLAGTDAGTGRNTSPPRSSSPGTTSSSSGSPG